MVPLGEPRDLPAHQLCTPSDNMDDSPKSIRADDPGSRCRAHTRSRGPAHAERRPRASETSAASMRELWQRNMACRCIQPRAREPRQRCERCEQEDTCEVVLDAASSTESFADAHASYWCRVLEGVRARRPSRPRKTTRLRQDGACQPSRAAYHRRGGGYDLLTTRRDRACVEKLLTTAHLPQVCSSQGLVRSSTGTTRPMAACSCSAGVAIRKQMGCRSVASRFASCLGRQGPRSVVSERARSP